MSQPIRYLEQTLPGDSGPGRVAYRHCSANTSMSGIPAETKTPGILFCGGFHSNMDGGKAEFLSGFCPDLGMAFTRFDYRGHGLSDGNFADGTIGDWYEDAKLIFDNACTGPQVVVGSSMGAWMAMMLARDRAARIKGLILIAPAPDFPRKLMLPALPPEARAALDRDGVWCRPSEFEDDPYPITRRLIEESAAHQMLDGPKLSVAGPVRILHGTADEVVPMAHAERVAASIDAPSVDLEIVDGGDHRLSTDADLARLGRAVAEVVQGL